MTTMQEARSIEEIEETIGKAINKVGGKRENDLCKYLPMSTGGYMHHFTLRKMKLKQPFELLTLIEKFIIHPSHPSAVAPKQRAARGSRKRRDQLMFTKTQLERLLSMAKVAGDQEMIVALSPKKSLAACKRDLLHSIKNNHANADLWKNYVDALDRVKEHGEELELEDIL
jgi:hypothetical protein